MQLLSSLTMTRTGLGVKAFGMMRKAGLLMKFSGFGLINMVLAGWAMVHVWMFMDVYFRSFGDND